VGGGACACAVARECHRQGWPRHVGAGCRCGDPDEEACALEASGVAA
jgi:hypothetical protein